MPTRKKFILNEEALRKEGYSPQKIKDLKAETLQLMRAIRADERDTKKKQV